jgi:hypothetical protein
VFHQPAALFPDTCEMTEVKAQPRKCYGADLFPFVGHKLRKDLPVFQKDAINAPDVCIFEAIVFVMPRSATLVITELFVRSANNWMAAFGTTAIDIHVNHKPKILCPPNEKMAVHAFIRKTRHRYCPV